MKSSLFLLLLFSIPAFAGTIPYEKVSKACYSRGIGKGDLSFFINSDKNLVKEGDNNNNTLLMVCAAQGREEIVNILLENGALVNFQSKSGETALHGAATYGREAIVWRLLKAGANKNLKDKYGKTAADNANKAGHYKIVEMLGGKPQNLFDDDKRKEAHKILDQAFKGEISVAEFERIFPPYGPLIDEPFNDGSTILFSAAYYNKNDLLAAALRLKADPNLPKENGSTPLMFAAWAKNYDGFKILIDAGAVPDLKNNEGKTAKDYAEENAKPLISDILEKEINKDLKNQAAIVSYLKDLTKRSKFKSKVKANEAKIKEMNKEMSAPKKSTPPPQKTNIVTPAKPSQPVQPTQPVIQIVQPTMPVMKMIADAFIAIDRGDVKIFIHLLNNGLPPDARDGLGNPMILRIAFTGNMQMLQALVSRGANINIKGVDGITALMVGVRHYKFDVVRYLVSIGADKRIRNNFNWTAFDVARQSRNEPMMAMTRF